MPTIAIVGAGPKVGLAIAHTFVTHGFDIALIARDHTPGQTQPAGRSQRGIMVGQRGLPGCRL